jgi:two-component system sensor histidine kinase KdpD
VLGTVGIVGLGLALTPLRGSFGLPGALLCLVLGVVVIAAIGGVPPALTAAVLAALTGDYFFTRPYHSFRMDHLSDVIALIVFFAVAALVSALVDRLARRGVQVVRAGAEAEALARLAGGSVLAGVEALPNLVAELRRVFDLDGVAILEPVDDHWRVAASAGDAPAPTRPDAAPFSAELDQGAYLVLAGPILDADDTRLLNAFVAQLREAQRRTRLETEAASASQLAEANSLRTALLAAVSHDLRTPLASIKAAATSLLSDEVRWQPDDIHEFAATIDDEADRLTSLVADLLDLSRLQTGVLPVSVSPTDVEYLLFSSAAALPSAGAGIDIDVGEALPLVLADAGLLQQALVNVLANAQNWSPPQHPVRVEAGTVEDRVTIRVVDQGPGIPPDQHDQVFLPFQRLGDGR